MKRRTGTYKTDAFFACARLWFLCLLYRIIIYMNIIYLFITTLIVIYIYTLQTNIIFQLLPIRDIITLYNYNYGNPTDSKYNQLNSQYRLLVPTSKKIYEYAILMAQISWNQGGIPIGAVLVDSNNNIISVGHNRRYQNNDPTAHAEIDCLKNAGNRTDWKCLTMISTLSCCDMCTGSIILYGIKNVIILEDITYQGPTHLLYDNHINVKILKTGIYHNYCVNMMKRLFSERNDLWNRDIGVTICKNNIDCVNNYGYSNNALCINNKCVC